MPSAADTAVRIVADSLSVRSPFVDIGTTLFGWLAAIAITWKGIEIVLEQGDFTRIMGDLLRNIFFIGLAYWFMPVGGHNSLVGIGDCPGDQCGFVGNLMISLTQAVGGNPQAMLSTGMNAFLDQIGLLGKTVMDVLTGGGNVAWYEFGKIIINLVNSLVILLYLLATILILYFGMLAYIVIWGMSQILVAVAKIFAPVMIPWMVLQPTSFLFDGWLRFFITASLYQVVGAVMLKIGNNMITGVASEISKLAAAAGQQDVWANVAAMAQISSMAMLAAGMSLLLVYMTMQIGQIAQGLVSGGAGFSIRNLGATMRQGLGNAGAASMQAAGKGMSLAGSAGNALGRQAQAAGVASAIGGGPFGGAMAAAGNAMRTGGQLARSVGNAIGGAGGQFEQNIAKKYKSLGKVLSNTSTGGGVGPGKTST